MEDASDNPWSNEIHQMFNALDGHGGCATHVYDFITGTEIEEHREARLINLELGHECY